MMTIPNTRLTIRPTKADIHHLDTIAAALRATGRPYCTRTDVVRHCLSVIAASVTVAPVTPQATPR